MTDEELATSLAAWVPAGVVAQALFERVDAPAHSAAETEMDFGSPVLPLAIRGGFLELVERYLHAFALPKSLLRVVWMHYERARDIPPEVAAEMLLMRFDGTIESTKRHNGSEVVRIVAPLSFCRLTQWPINMLHSAVTHLSVYYDGLSRNGRSPMSYHHSQTYEWEFTAWLDAFVAQRFGFSTIGPAGIEHVRTIEEVVRGRSLLARWLNGQLPPTNETTVVMQLVCSATAFEIEENFLHGAYGD